eukprot:7343997-Alexandrium_andersonii.AAC.1
MSASLVGSEMCIRDRIGPAVACAPWPPSVPAFCAPEGPPPEEPLSFRILTPSGTFGAGVLTLSTGLE